MNAIRPSGAASTRKAVQVPKKAPVASPWMARATSRPVRSGSVIRITCATARVAIAPSSTRPAADPVRHLPEGEHRGHQRHDVAAEKEGDDRVAEAEPVLVERDQGGDQAGAEREQHQHRPGAPDPAHPPTMPKAGEAALLPRAVGAQAAVAARRRAGPPPRPAGSPTGRRAAGGSDDAREEPRWASAGTFARSARPAVSPAASDCDRRRGAPRPRRPARRPRGCGGRARPPRGSTSRASDRPPAEGGPRLGEQARAAADIERRPGGQRPRARSRHIAVVGWSPGPKPSPATCTSSRTPAGAARWAGLRRYQPGQHRRGRVGPARHLSQRPGSGRGSAASAARAASGAQRGAQTSPAALHAHRLERAERGERRAEVLRVGPRRAGRGAARPPR